MLRDLIDFRVGARHAEIMAAQADIEELAASIQVGLADEGLVLPRQDVESALIEIKRSGGSRKELVDAVLRMVET
ncbi:MAG: hypothetical protein AB1486_02760 [Planctomycetota bacterium]